MTDPQPEKLKPRPRRAEPMQPDRPTSGGDAMPTDEHSTEGEDEDKQAALKRGGYPPGKST